MFTIEPNTDLYLLKVPLEINDINQLTFANKTAQANYFKSLERVECAGFSYQRKDDVVRIDGKFEDIMSFNYVMYRNNSYDDKWFYAFIEDLKYINDNLTDLKIKTDVWQTWQFDLRFKPTFVQREHVNNDTVGANTVPEHLETGEPVVNDSVLAMGAGLTGYYITFMVSDTSPLNLLDKPASQYNGIFSGYTLFGVSSTTDANAIVKKYISDNVIDSICNIFMVPKSLYGTASSQLIDVTTPAVTIYFPQNLTTPVSVVDQQTVSRNVNLDGFVPKNNKLFTYPYSYLFVTNNVGGNVEYRYEDFTNATPKFRLSGIISSGCDIKLNPLYYKNVSTPNQAYGLKMGKLPVCSWNTDAYAVWLAQNQLNMTVNMGKALIDTAKVAAIGGGGAGATSIIDTIYNSVAGGYLAQHLPDQVHGDPNSSDFNFSADLFFEFRRMSIRAEYARIIDEFFSAYGYAVNRVKLPNITGRRNWNYIKTTNCYIEADIPQGDLSEIKSLFDNGITLWHNPATFADYTQNNDII